MKRAAFEMKYFPRSTCSLFTRAQTTKVFSRFRHDVGSEFHLNAALWRAADCYIEEYNRIFRRHQKVWELCSKVNKILTSIQDCYV
mmetsp:Transcript_18276/g.52780  ORF Transcript_18276/g.52780 Transcript_18276/m.52780 type:complete len:86 (+) Transcript_18276:602-859(+)